MTEEIQFLCDVGIFQSSRPIAGLIYGSEQQTPLKPKNLPAMEDPEVQEGELRDEVGCLKFSPPPMKKSDTRDSISSVDSDVSLSFDRRGSKGEEADADFSDSGSSELENTETALVASMQRITCQAKPQQRHKTKSNPNDPKNDPEALQVSSQIQTNDPTDNFDKNDQIDLPQSNGIVDHTTNRKTTDEDDDEEIAQCSEELAEKIAAQVEFYFSDENILKDAFLLKHVRRNKEGYVRFSQTYDENNILL